MLKALCARSIASRLFLSAAFWSILILALAGLGLSGLNKQWSEANFDDQLGVYLRALVAHVAVPSEERKIAAPAALAATFLTLALALIGSTALAVRFGLRPLRVLREGVAAI